MPELVPRNTSVSNEESSRVSDRMNAARIAGRSKGTRIRTIVRLGEAPHIRADSSSAASMLRKAGIRKIASKVAQPVTLTKIKPPYEKMSSGPVSPAKNGRSRSSWFRYPFCGLRRSAQPSTLPSRGKKNDRISRNSSRLRNGQSVRAMIHARTTASASASTARTVDSHTVVQRICHTSGCAITANDARIDSTEIAPGRPGGASRKPASSAVATGVTVSTATVISSNVGSHAPALTRGHARPRTRFSPAATAMSVIEKLRGDDPLEDFGDLALGLVVAGVLELVLGRVVEWAGRDVGARGRVAERLHPPLRVFAAQHEVDEDLGGVRVRRVLDDGEEWRLRADAARLEAELGDRYGAQAVLHPPRAAEHRMELAAGHLARLVEAKELRLEPGELANEPLAVLLGVDSLQTVDVVDADVRDPRIRERHALALDQIDPVGIAHEVPVALGVLLGRHELGVDVQAADAREDAGEVRLLVHDGPAPLHAGIERRRRDELVAQAAPGDRPAALATALVDVGLHAARGGLGADLLDHLVARAEHLAHLDVRVDLVEDLDRPLGLGRLGAAVPDDLALFLRGRNDLRLPLRHGRMEPFGGRRGVGRRRGRRLALGSKRGRDEAGDGDQHKDPRDHRGRPPDCHHAVP